MVGYWSDNTRFSVGAPSSVHVRSGSPVACCYSLLWQPPDWSDEALFLYLVVLAVLIRALITVVRDAQLCADARADR
ncbi:MAG: hypothetical protein CM15mP74_29360 [Halieaceae bacterium]|nr:MAG: hypothetical protein CM15mP74_29360 [Halieaceae bacterium]